MAERSSDAYRDPRTLGTRLREAPGGTARLTVNLDESPLATLARRKGRDGKAFLDANEIEAGERLRRDFTRGQLMPGLSSNWRAPVTRGKSTGARSNGSELTDSALGARTRVNDAIRAVGPELSGVLVDVCCFLKGLEQVERERSWPARSGKLMLKTALSALDRYYQPQRSRPSAGRGSFHWGSADYKPSHQPREA